MLLNFLSRLETVKQATTTEELEAIWRLRYEVYVTELDKKFLANIDHQKKWIKDERDTHPDSLLCYTGTPDNIKGSLRIDTWAAEQIPEDVYKRFSLHLFPNLKDVNIAEVVRLVIPKKHRGLLITPALVREVYKFSAIKKNVAYWFMYCAPGLVSAYNKMGYRPYAGDLIYNSDGVRIPMLCIGSDLEYLKKVGAPYTDIATKHFGKTNTQLIIPIEQLLKEGLNYELSPEQVWLNLQETVLNTNAHNYTLMSTLSEESMQYLSQKGFLIDVVPNHKIVSQGLLEQEMFVILSGCFEVTVNNKQVAILNKGELFGEMAFFLDTNKRTATVRSLTRGKLLVLRRKYINEIRTDNPALAVELLLGVCKTLTGRLAKML